MGPHVWHEITEISLLDKPDKPHGKHNSFPSALYTLSMQQDSHQRDGPSPSRPVGPLRFQKTPGLIMHKRKAEDVEFRRHTKIHLAPSGDLRLTTEVFTTPHKATIPQRSLTWDHSIHLPYLAIPECKDRLPPEVDLGILDIEPRQLRDSVSLVWLIAQFELIQILIRMPHSSRG